MASVTIQASDGSGSFSAYLVEPKARPAGVVVLIQEIFGVNQAMRDIAAWVADMRFVAVCPDLFWRIEPASTSPTRPRPNGSGRSNCSTSSTRRRASKT